MIQLNFERETRHKDNADGFETTTIGTERVRVITQVNTQHHIISAMIASGWTLGWCMLSDQQETK